MKMIESQGSLYLELVLPNSVSASQPKRPGFESEQRLRGQRSPMLGHVFNRSEISLWM